MRTFRLVKCDSNLAGGLEANQHLWLHADRAAGSSSFSSAARRASVFSLALRMPPQLELAPTFSAALGGKILPNAHAAGDLNADGLTELVFGSVTGALAVFKVRPAGGGGGS